MCVDTSPGCSGRGASVGRGRTIVHCVSLGLSVVQEIVALLAVAPSTASAEITGGVFGHGAEVGV